MLKTKIYCCYGYHSINYNLLNIGYRLLFPIERGIRFLIDISERFKFFLSKLSDIFAIKCYIFCYIMVCATEYIEASVVKRKIKVAIKNKKFYKFSKKNQKYKIIRKKRKINKRRKLYRHLKFKFGALMKIMRRIDVKIKKSSNIKLWRRKNYVKSLILRMKSNVEYQRTTKYVTKLFYNNYIYFRLIGLLYIFILIYIKRSALLMAKVVYGLWVRYISLSKYKDISIELYSYLYNDVSLFKFYKYLSLEQFIVRGNILIVTRYVDYLKSSRLFLLDTNSKGKLVYALGRRSLSLYVYINPGLRKIRGNKRKIACFK